MRRRRVHTIAPQVQHSKIENSAQESNIRSRQSRLKTSNNTEWFDWREGFTKNHDRDIIWVVKLRHSAQRSAPLYPLITLDPLGIEQRPQYQNGAINIVQANKRTTTSSNNFWARCNRVVTPKIRTETLIISLKGQGVLLCNLYNWKTQRSYIRRAR